MRAIRVHEFGGPEQMRLEEVADLRPGPGQVLVRVHAAGVNPVDTYIRGGGHAVKPPRPYTPGVDGAGVVMAVGQGVTRVAGGARVYLAGSVSGTYAEQSLCLETQVHPLPDRASFAQGAALGIPYVTAYRALFQIAKARPGETVLVHGASGGVGVAATQLARAAGLVVIGTASTEGGMALVRAEGAHHVVDHSAPDAAAQIATIAGPGGVDVILEMLANRNLATDLTLVGKGGRIAVIGSRGPIEINPRDAMVREAAVLGVFLFAAPEADLAAAHAAIGGALESGVARPVVGREMPLAEAHHAHEAVMWPGSHGKIVLNP